MKEFAEAAAAAVVSAIRSSASPTLWNKLLKKLDLFMSVRMPSRDNGRYGSMSASLIILKTFVRSTIPIVLKGNGVLNSGPGVTT